MTRAFLEVGLREYEAEQKRKKKAKPKRQLKPRNHKPALRGNGNSPKVINVIAGFDYDSPPPPLRAHDYLPHTYIGELVQFYSDGLRAGHIESISKGIAKIRPIAPYKAGPGRLVKKPLVELIICARPPRGEGHLDR